MDYKVVIGKTSSIRSKREKSLLHSATRRFPPAVQFLTSVDPAVQNHLTSLAWQGHRQNRSLKDICAGLSALSKALGYETAIGVQEVTTENMPSYPGQKVMTALIMIDIRPVGSPAKSVKRAPGTGGAKEYHRAS